MNPFVWVLFLKKSLYSKKFNMVKSRRGIDYMVYGNGSQCKDLIYPKEARSYR